VRYRVYVPTTLLSREAEERFVAAEDVELVFALPEDERTYSSARAAERSVRVAEALAEALPTIDALCAVGVNKQLVVDAKLLARARRLRVIFVPGSGTDTIDLDAATARGIAVVNAPGANAPAVAEHTLGLMLALTRKIAVADRTAHIRRALASSDLSGLPELLRDKTLLVVGMGFIGREVTRICQALGVTVAAIDPRLDPVEAEQLRVHQVIRLADGLASADVVSLHAPLTPATRHLIGWEELVSMRRSALLINTARGGLVDTEAMVNALQTDEIAGAGLDVTDPEPLPEGHPLFACGSVVLTPHAAGSSARVRTRASVIAAEGALQALHGERPSNLVNSQVWDRFCARFRSVG